VAEAALRGILRKARTRQMSDLPDEQEPDGTPLTLSPPDIRSIDGADWYVWPGATASILQLFVCTLIGTLVMDS